MGKENLSRRFHVIIDACNCKPGLITDRQKLDKAIRKLARLCEMKILHGPVVIEGMPVNPGLTGFAVIDFSHISIHTFVPSNEICVDIFSCKKFDCDAVKKYVKEVFGLDDESTKIIDVK
jgi:S-adenosylmethionine/arginine decarboxylase-like enzyme